MHQTYLLDWFGWTEELTFIPLRCLFAAALDQVKIVLPKTAETPGSEVPLNAIATVSTKANVLTINIFDETVSISISSTRNGSLEAARLEEDASSSSLSFLRFSSFTMA